MLLEELLKLQLHRLYFALCCAIRGDLQFQFSTPHADEARSCRTHARYEVAIGIHPALPLLHTSQETAHDINYKTYVVGQLATRSNACCHMCLMSGPQFDQIKSKILTSTPSFFQDSTVTLIPFFTELILGTAA
jgi:hypothetical protein